MVNKSKKRDLTKLWNKCLSRQSLAYYLQDILIPEVKFLDQNFPNEKVWLSDAKFAFLYAKYIRGTRWSEKDEVVFYNDFKALYNYVYWVVKDKGENCPDHFHNFMLASAVADKKNEWIDLYFKNIAKDSIKK